MKSTYRIRRLTIAALGATLVCVSTRILQFPIPLGYAHLGNSVLLLFAVYFDPWVGAFAGGIGSALADLMSYPEWALPTLVIKSLMGFVAAVLAKKRGQSAKLRTARTLVSALATIAIMIAGYFAAGSLLYGSAITGAAQIPGLALEGLLGVVLFYVLAAALESAGILRRVAEP